MLTVIKTKVKICLLNRLNIITSKIRIAIYYNKSKHQLYYLNSVKILLLFFIYWLCRCHSTEWEEDFNMFFILVLTLACSHNQMKLENLGFDINNTLYINISLRIIWSY